MHLTAGPRGQRTPSCCLRRCVTVRSVDYAAECVGVMQVGGPCCSNKKPFPGTSPASATTAAENLMSMLLLAVLHVLPACFRPMANDLQPHAHQHAACDLKGLQLRCPQCARKRGLALTYPQSWAQGAGGGGKESNSHSRHSANSCSQLTTGWHCMQLQAWR